MHARMQLGRSCCVREKRQVTQLTQPPVGWGLDVWTLDCTAVSVEKNYDEI
jgi:hypothetical protein